MAFRHAMLTFEAIRSTLGQTVATLSFLLLLCVVVMYLTGDLIRGVSCWTKSVIKYLCIYLSIYVRVYIFIWPSSEHRIYFYIMRAEKLLHAHTDRYTHSHSTMVFTLLLFPVVVCAFLFRMIAPSLKSYAFIQRNQNKVSDRLSVYHCVNVSWKFLLMQRVALKRALVFMFSYISERGMVIDIVACPLRSRPGWRLSNK